MKKFNTLLLREWMQHRLGWLILMFAVPAFIMVTLLFPNTVQLDGQVPEPLMLAAVSTLAVSTIVLSIALIAVVFQAQGLARRDQQDRTIEFWLSLPVGHATSIGATLFAHLLAMPLLALAAGWACSLVIALEVVAKVSGASALAGLPWLTLAAIDLGVLLRLAFGVVLAVLWASPLVLLTMVASAWLKRWGVPVVVAVLSGGHVLLATVYGIRWIGDTTRDLLFEARNALLPLTLQSPGDLNDWLPQAPQWLAQDALAALQALAQPLFVGALVVSAVCFGLLVLRRQRTG